MSANGRVALVTGGAHRVGKAIVLGLAEHGLRIALHYAGSVAAAEETARELRERGTDVQLFRADLRDAAAPAQLIEQVVAHFGSLHVLVNSAAVMERTPLGSVTAEALDAIFALNTRAPFLLAQAAQPHLARTHGSIVNMADLAAFEAWPAYIPHAMSKAAIVQMTRGLAHAMAPDVRVNAIAPGAVLLPNDWDAAAARHFVETTPLGRLGSPDDVVGAVRYLIDAAYVTGETIIVDGGRHVRS